MARLRFDIALNSSRGRPSVPGRHRDTIVASPGWPRHGPAVAAPLPMSGPKGENEDPLQGLPPQESAHSASHTRRARHDHGTRPPGERNHEGLASPTCDPCFAWAAGTRRSGSSRNAASLHDASSGTVAPALRRSASDIRRTTTMPVPLHAVEHNADRVCRGVAMHWNAMQSCITNLEVHG